MVARRYEVRETAGCLCIASRLIPASSIVIGIIRHDASRDWNKSGLSSLQFSGRLKVDVLNSWDMFLTSISAQISRF